MARSTYVYVVQEGDVVAAGFTVKHELMTWLRRQGPRLGALEVTRVHDGGDRPEQNATVDAVDLLQGEA